MYYRAIRPQHFNINLAETGGLGDNIARLPAIKWFEHNHPYVSLNVIVPDYFKELAQFLLPENEKRKYFSVSEINGRPTGVPSPIDLSLPMRSVKGEGFHTTMSTHLTDHAFHMLCDTSVEYEAQKHYMQPYLSSQAFLNILNKFSIDYMDNYVILTTGCTAPVREWPAQQVNAVARYLVDKGYKVIFLGTKIALTGGKHNINAQFSEEIDFSLGLDLRERTTLIEALYIIDGAMAIVGLDNGLLHLAGCTAVPIVAGFTNVRPELRKPYRPNGEFRAVTSSVCKNCQNSCNFVVGFDFRYCYYNLKCNELIGTQKYIDALKEIL